MLLSHRRLLLLGHGGLLLLGHGGLLLLLSHRRLLLLGHGSLLLLLSHRRLLLLHPVGLAKHEGRKLEADSLGSLNQLLLGIASVALGLSLYSLLHSLVGSLLVTLLHSLHGLLHGKLNLLLSLLLLLSHGSLLLSLSLLLLFLALLGLVLLSLLLALVLLGGIIFTGQPVEGIDQVSVSKVHKSNGLLFNGHGASFLAQHLGSDPEAQGGLLGQVLRRSSLLGVVEGIRAHLAHTNLVPLDLAIGVFGLPTVIRRGVFLPLGGIAVDILVSFGLLRNVVLIHQVRVSSLGLCSAPAPCSTLTHCDSSLANVLSKVFRKKEKPDPFFLKPLGLKRG